MMKRAIAGLLVAGGISLFMAGCQSSKEATPAEHPAAAVEKSTAAEHPVTPAEAEAAANKPASMPKDHPAH